MLHQHNILVTAGLTNKKLQSKLHGLLNCQTVKKVYLIRRKPLSIQHTKLLEINPPDFIKKNIILYEFWRFYKFCAIIYSHNIHVLYAIQLIPNSFHTYIASILFQKPMILSVIGDDVHIHLKKRVTGFILKTIIKQASIITVLGNQSATNIRNTGFSDEKIIKLLNYIDDSKFINNKNKQKKQWDLIFTGGLVSIKSLDMLIEAFSIVSAKLNNIRLCIVGDGPEKDKLQLLTKQLGCTEKIDFIGKTNNVDNYLNQSKILIMTSKSEALPASAIEATFYGLPTILPRVGDIPDFFSNNINCLLFSTGNMDELVSSIFKLLENKNFYSQLSYGSIKLKNKYLSQWNSKQQAAYWDQIFKNLKI